MKLRHTKSALLFAALAALFFVWAGNSHAIHTVGPCGGAICMDPPLPVCVTSGGVSGPQITLDWSDTFHGANPTFRIYRMIPGETGYVQIGSTNTNIFTDTVLNGLVSDKSYRYQIRGQKGGDPEQFSNEQDVAPLYCEPVILSAPASCAADGPHITLNWSSITGSLDKYEIYRDGAKISETTGTSFNDGPNIQGGVSYNYKIRAIWLDTTYRETSVLPMTALFCAPTLTAVSSCENTVLPGGPRVDLSWNSLLGVTSYQIYRKAQSEAVFSLLDAVPSASTGYVDFLANSLNATYHTGGNISYYIKAIWADTDKDSSPPQTITIPRCAPYLSVDTNCQDFAFNLSWTKTKDALHYNVYRNGTFIVQRVGATNTTYDDFMDLTLCPGEQCSYTYRVEAIVSGNPNMASADILKSIDCTITVPPDPSPTLDEPVPFCESGDSRIALGTSAADPGWSASSNILNYSIFRDNVRIADTTARWHIDQSVESNFIYNYRVTAVGEGGSAPSANNFTVTAVSCIPPIAPSITSLVASCSAGAPRVDIAWSNAGNAVSYVIHRGTAPGALSPVITFNQTAPEFTSRTWQDASVSPSTTYYYKVVANGPQGVPSSSSSESSITTTSCMPTTPVVSLSTTCVSGSARVTVLWSTDHANTTQYKVERQDAGGGNLVTFPLQLPPTTSLLDTSVERNKAYEYKVTAQGPAGNSSSGFVPITSDSCLPTTPAVTFSRSCSAGSSRITLNWSTDEDYTDSYEIFRKDFNEFVPIAAILDPSIKTWLDAGPLAYDTLYEYKVEAVGGVSSLRSTEGYHPVISENCSPPGAFTLSVDTPPMCVGSYLRSNLSWTESVNATSYELDRTDVASAVTSQIYSTPYPNFGFLNPAFLEFDGTDDYVEIPSSASLSPSAEVSVEAWVNMYSCSGSDGTVVAKTNGIMDSSNSVRYALWYEGDGVCDAGDLSFCINDAEYDDDNCVSIDDGMNPENVWTHYLGTYNGSKLRIYRDGVLLGSKSLTSAIANGSGHNVRIGSNGVSGGGQAISGNIDEVRIYDRALSELEVQEHYNGIFNNNTGLVGLWHFNDLSPSQTASDSSGSGNSGTLGSSGGADQNDPRWRTPAKLRNFLDIGLGNALSFDGGDYVFIPDDPSLEPSSAITVAAWIRPTAVSGTRAVVNKHNSGESDSYTLTIDNRRLRWCPAEGGGGSCVYGGNIMVDQWHHVAGTYDGTMMRSYINGREVAFKVDTGTLAYSSSRLLIGSEDLGEFFSGAIDEVHIYSRVLTSAEIQGLYEGTFSAAPSDIAGIWHLDEDATTQFISDSSNNGNNGTRGPSASSESADPSWVISGQYMGFQGDYNWRAEALNVGGNVFATPNPTANYTAPLCEPPKAGLVLTPVCTVAGEEAIFVEWSYSINATQYKLYREEGAVDPLIATVSQSPDPLVRSFTDDNAGAGLLPATPHSHYVVSEGLAGNTVSSVITATTFNCAPPTPPANVLATFTCLVGFNYPRVVVTWDDSLNTTYYVVYRDGAPVSPSISDTGAASYSWTDTGVAVNTAYTYAVRAFGVGGQFADSAPASVLAGNFCPPSAPVIYVMSTRCEPTTPPNSHAVNTLTWSDATPFNTTSYKIFRNTTGGGPLDPGDLVTTLPIGLVTILPGGMLAWDDTTLPDNQPQITYYYWVQAIGNAPHPPAMSASKTFTSFSCGVIPSKPTGVTVGNLQCLNGIPSADVSWTDGTPAYSHGVYRTNPDASVSVYNTRRSTFTDVGAYALGFDGVNDYVSVSGLPSLALSNLSVSLWIRPNVQFNSSSGLLQPLRDNGSGYEIIYNCVPGALTFSVGGGCNGSDPFYLSNLEANTWYHIVGTYYHGSRRATLYINGAQVDSEISTRVPAASSGICVGASCAPGRFTRAIIDDVRIYSRELSSAEVWAVYSSTFNNEAGLVGMWHFDDGAGIVAKDDSGNGYNGTLVNDPSWIRVSATEPNYVASMGHGNPYTFRVKAFGPDTESEFSDPATITSLSCLPPAPIAALNDICTSYNEPIATINWNQTVNTVSYDIIKNGLQFKNIIPNSNGFIKDWLLVGPFALGEVDPSVEENALNTIDYIQGEAGTKPRAGETVGGKTWVERNVPTHYLNLDFEFSPNNDHALGYAFAYVYSPTAIPSAQLRLGVEDGVKVYLNGTHIGTNYVINRSASQDNVIFPVSLNAGINTVLIKVVERHGGWLLLARFTDTAGNPILTNLTAWDSTAATGAPATYKVVSNNLGGGSPSADVISSPPDCTPLTPVFDVTPQCVTGDSQMKLEWGADPNARYWSIFKRRLGFPFAKLIDVNSPTISYSDGDIQSDVVYEYYIETFGFKGPSKLSNSDSGTALICANPPAKPAFVPPTPEPVCFGTSSRIKSKWTLDGTGSTLSFNVRRKNITLGEPSFSIRNGEPIAPTDDDFYDLVTALEDYQYQIEAVGSGANNISLSDPSLTVTALDCTNIPPNPAALSLSTVVSTGDLVSTSLSWTDSGSEQDYRIFRSDGGPLVEIAHLVSGVDYLDSDTTIFYVDNSVIDGMNYAYRIYAYNNSASYDSLNTLKSFNASDEPEGGIASNDLLVFVPVAVPGVFSAEGVWVNLQTGPFRITWTAAPTTANGGCVNYTVYNDDNASFSSPVVVCTDITEASDCRGVSGPDLLRCDDTTPTLAERFYRVTATNVGGSTNSNTVELEPPLPQYREIAP